MDTVIADILSEPQVVAETIAEGRLRQPPLVDRLGAQEPELICTFGAGSSCLVGHTGRYALEELTGIPVLAYSAMDFLNYGVRSSERRVIALAISQSGETFETILAARAAKERGLFTVALTNTEQSTLAEVCDAVLLTRAGQESGPGTKTVIAQGAAIYQFALFLAGERRPDRSRLTAAWSELDSAAECVAEMLADATSSDLTALARQFASAQHVYLLGAGSFGVLASQTANFLAEVGKVHCHPFEATEFRHGPLELVSEGALVVVLSNGSCKGASQIARACRATANTGATLAYVGGPGGRPDGEFAVQVNLPDVSELLAGVLYLAPLQLAGWQTAQAKQLDPTRFVNIVKTWTE